MRDRSWDAYTQRQIMAILSGVAHKARLPPPRTPCLPLPEDHVLPMPTHDGQIVSTYQWGPVMGAVVHVEQDLVSYIVALTDKLIDPPPQP